MEKKRSAKQKKLGAAIVALFVAAIAITVVLSSLVTMTMFRNYNDGILIERAKIGMGVLKDYLQNQIVSVEDDFWILTEDEDFRRAAVAANAEQIDPFYQDEFGGNPDNFLVIADRDGNIIYKKGNYPFSTFDLRAVAEGSTVSGIVQCDGELAVIYAASDYAYSTKFVVACGFAMETNDWLNGVKSITECDVTIFNNNIRYSTTLDQSVLGTPMADNIKKVVLDSSSAYSGQAVIGGNDYYVAYEPLYDVNRKLVGAYFAGSDATDANTEFANVTVASTSTAIILVIASAVIIFIFSRKRVIIPIRQVSILAEEMERGQLSTTEVNYIFENDEVGMFARKLRYTKKDLSSCISDISGILDGMAGGDFTQAPNVEYPGDFGAIRTSILKIEDDLGDTLSRMNTSSDEVLEGSNQMAEGSQSLADGTTKQASAIEEISATIAEVSTQIAQTAENAAQAGELSKQTQDKVNMQDAEIQSMVSAMNEISDTSKEIEKIIKTIEDISFQTNILALNAAVEAARAGDAGKGFAVVADEVRNLATKSAEAANSTTSLITASIEAVDKGSKIALSTAESMKDVKNMSTDTAELISQIAVASQEQNESIKEINAGIEQISQVIQMNSATAEETAASCEELSGQSRLLKDQVARFKVNS